MSPEEINRLAGILYEELRTWEDDEYTSVAEFASEHGISATKLFCIMLMCHAEGIPFKVLSEHYKENRSLQMQVLIDDILGDMQIDL